MKHIILYENFGSEIFEQDKTLASGAILRTGGGTLKAGELYANFSEDETAPSLEISYMKDGQTRVSMTFAGGEGISIKTDGDKELTGAKCYVSLRKYSGDEGAKPAQKGINTVMNEANTSAMLDTFFGYAGVYSEGKAGAMLAEKLVKTLFELKKDPTFKDITPLMQTTIAMTNQAKLGKPIVASTMEGAKGINEALTKAVKEAIKA